jgi:hypothetical protein
MKFRFVASFGLFLLAACSAEAPATEGVSNSGSAIVAARRVPCEDLGGTCRASPVDPSFPAHCENFGERTEPKGVCSAVNLSCCVP